MANLFTQYRVDVYNDDKELFGNVFYEGDSCQWSIPDIMNLPDFSGSGLVTDPTGQYVLNQCVNVPYPTGTVHWVNSDGTDINSSADAPTDAVKTAANKFFSNAVHELTSTSFVKYNAGKSFSVVHDYHRNLDEGIRLEMWRGGTNNGLGIYQTTFYVYFNTNGKYDPTISEKAFYLRLAVESDKPIRIQNSYDNENWTDIATADALGSAEDYLSSTDRKLNVDVLPLTDISWKLGLPQSAALSDSPPNKILFVIGDNDAVLEVPTDVFLDGNITVSGGGGQWNLKKYIKRYQNTSTCTTPVQIRMSEFQSEPSGDIFGYVPANTQYEVVPNLVDTNKASATLNIQLPSDPTNIGGSLRTVMISRLKLVFPEVISEPSPFTNNFVSYYPVAADVTSNFNQETLTVTQSATLTFSNNLGVMMPGINVVPAYRAIRIYEGYSDQFGNTIWNLVMTGWANDFHWFIQDKQYYCTVQVQDRLNSHDISCGYMLPFDGECHYAVMRLLLYKLGITNNMMKFPYVQIGSQDDGYYHLPSGTTLEPLMQFRPEMMIRDACEQVRGYSADFDTATQQIQPMILRTDPLGNVRYEPMEIGLLSAVLNPGQSIFGFNPVAKFSTSDLDNISINQITGALEVRANLKNIRTRCFVEGLDLLSGGAVTGLSYNPDLELDSSTFGYVGLKVPIYLIDKKFNTVEFAQRQAELMRIQTSFPSIQLYFETMLQPNLFPLNVIAVQDLYTNGTPNYVFYYITSITSGMTTENMHRTGYSRITCNLIGEA